MPANMGFPMPPPAAPEQQDFMARLMAALGGSQGLMNLGGNLLAASGPSPQRVGLGQAMGGSLLANQQFQQAQQDQQLKQLLMASQIQKNNRGPLGSQKPVAVLGPDGKPKLVSQQDAVGMEPYYSVNRAEAPAVLQEYKQYQDDEKAAGRVPKAYMDWLPIRAKSNVGAPFVLGDFLGGRAMFDRTNPTDVRPLSTADQEADAARKIAESKASGAATGEKTAAAAFDLPRVEQNTNQAIKALKDLRGHKGLGAITGLYSLAPVVPGTDQAAADALAQQVEGKTFLEAFNTLKGAGAITETEGGKATSAIGRLQRSQSKADYQAALDDLTSVLESGLDRARKTASGGKPSPVKRSREEILKQYGVQ